MAVSTFAELKAHFKSPKVATVQAWTDVLDTIQRVIDQLNAAIAAGSPVVVVANQAARLALGPTLVIGQMVKQTDDGVTYSKQTEPGSSTLDWVATGDVKVELSDVFNLIPELNRRLINDGNDLAQRLGVAQTWYHALPNVALVDDEGMTLPVDPFSPQYSYATVNEDCRIVVAPSELTDYSGRCVQFLTYNPELTDVALECPIGSYNQGDANLIVLPSKKLVWLTFLFVTFPGDASPSFWILHEIEE